MFYSIHIHTVVVSTEKTIIRKVTGDVPRLFTAADDFHRLQLLSQCNKSLFLSDTKEGQAAPPRMPEFDQCVCYRQGRPLIVHLHLSV